MLDSGDMGELGHNRAKDFLNSRSYKAMIGKRVKSVVFLALHYYICTKESLGLEIPMILFFWRKLTRAGVWQVSLCFIIDGTYS